MFDFDPDSPLITAVRDQADAAMTEMPAEVKHMLCEYYTQDAMVTLMPIWQQLLPRLQQLMTDEHFGYLAHDVIDAMKSLAFAGNLISHTNKEIWLGIGIEGDPSTMDEAKAAAWVELLDQWSDKFESVFHIKPPQ